MSITDPAELSLYATDLITKLAILPFGSAHLYQALNEPGSGEIKIPLASDSAALVESGMLIVVSYRGNNRGVFFVENITRFHADASEGGGEWMSITGRGGLALLEDAIIFDGGDGLISTRDFANVSKASILKTLIDEAQARGSLAALTYDFSATLDSDGEVWSDSENLKLTVGTSLLDVVRQFAKTGIDFDIEFSGGGFILHAYKLGIGTDISETTYFRTGVNCEEVHGDERGDEITNVYRVSYRGGSLTLTDPASIIARRRREKYLDAKAAQSSASATTYGAAVLENTKDPKNGISVKIYDGIGPRVYVDYIIGDTITLDIKGVQTTYRVLGLQCDFDGDNFSNIVVELNNLLFENEIKMSQQLSFLLNQWNTAHDAELLEVTYWAGIGTWETQITTVNAMHIIGDVLYVGGVKVGGGETVNKFGFYNISSGQWDSRTTGTINNVLCFASIGTDLYIGGATGSGASGGCVQKYDTLTGTLTALNLEAFDSGTDFSTCRALAVIGTDLYAAGSFFDGDGVTVYNVAKYDTVGVTWEALGVGITGGNPAYPNGLSLAVIGSDLYVGGNFDDADGVTVSNVAKWNGVTFEDLGGGLDDFVWALKNYNGNLLAGGAFTGGVSEWDGLTWTTLGSGTAGTVYALDVYLTDVYLAGDFTDVGNYISKYSGGVYFTLTEGLNDIGYTVVLDDIDVYVGGDFTTAGTKDVNLMAVYFNNFESLLDYLDSANGFDLGQAIHNATAAAITDAGEIPFWDAVTRKLRKITWANIKATLKTYFDTLYVDLLTDQVVAGIKRFSDSIVIGIDPPVAGGDGSTNQAIEGASAGNIAWTWGTGFASFFTGVYANGTKASPTKILANQVMVKFRGRAHDNSDYAATSAELRFVANQDHSSTAHGARAELYTTTDGATSLIRTATFENQTGGNIEAGLVMPYVGTPVLKTLRQDFNTRGSSGVSDGTLTYVTADLGAGTHHIQVAAGEGYIRTSNDQQGDLVFIEWSASTGIAIPNPAAGQETTRFIGIEYNSGTPQVTVRTTFDWNWYDDFPLARVSWDGTDLHILNAYAHTEDTANLTRKFLRLVLPFQRESAPEGSGGLEITDVATRQLAMTAGNVWHGFNRYVMSAVTAGTSFDIHYRDGAGGFNFSTTATQWPNTQYDNNSGTLVTMTNNRYACLWIYLDISDGTLNVIYGRNQYVSSAGAQAEAVPTTPPHLTYHGRLIARLIFQKSAAAATIVESAWSTVFMPSSGASTIDAANVTYTPAVLADWTGSADPGAASNAFDQLAQRVTDAEASLQIENEVTLSIGQLSNAKADIYDPGSSIAKVDSIVIHNIDTVNEETILYLHDGTNEYKIWDETLAPNETQHLPFYNSFIVDAAAKITGNAVTAANKVNCMVTGSIVSSGKILAFKQLASSVGDLYVPSGVNGKVTFALLHNDNSTTETVVLNHYNGTTYELYKVDIPTKKTAIVSLGEKGWAIANGSKVTGSTTTASKVTCLLAGSERA